MSHGEIRIFACNFFCWPKEDSMIRLLQHADIVVRVPDCNYMIIQPFNAFTACLFWSFCLGNNPQFANHHRVSANDKIQSGAAVYVIKVQQIL